VVKIFVTCDACQTLAFQQSDHLRFRRVQSASTQNGTERDKVAECPTFSPDATKSMTTYGQIAAQIILVTFMAAIDSTSLTLVEPYKMSVNGTSCHTPIFPEGLKFCDHPLKPQLKAVVKPAVHEWQLRADSFTSAKFS
jgi:hypothetical protein